MSQNIDELLNNFDEISEDEYSIMGSEPDDYADNSDPDSWYEENDEDYESDPDEYEEYDNDDYVEDSACDCGTDCKCAEDTNSTIIKTIDIDESQLDASDDEIVVSPKPSKWGHKLSESKESNEFIVTEFGSHTYSYKKITDPSNKETKYFTCHCNVDNAKDKSGNLVWYTKHQCLSQHYVTLNLETIVKDLTKELTFNNIKVFTKSPFILSWKGDYSDTLDLFPSNPHIKYFYKALSGLDPDKEFKNLSNTLEVYAINSYDGTSAVSVNFALNLNFQNADSVYSGTDYFILSNRMNKIRHMGTVSQIKNVIENAKIDINSDMLALSNYTDDIDDIAKELSTKFRKDVKSSFTSYWNDFTGSMKNLLCLSALTSKCLSSNYTAKQHLALQIILNKYVPKAIKQYKQNTEEIA